MKTHATTLRAAAAAAALAIAGAGPALAEFPSGPITIVAAWPAGGSHDTAARLIAQELTEVLDVPVVVNNVTGAAGATGVRYIENAAPDGRTIGIIGMHAISQAYMNPNATRLDNIQPIIHFAEDPGALQVLAETGITTVDEYIEAMQANPGALLNGNDPQGGNSFVFANVLRDSLGLDMVQIPYAGHAPNVTGLITGEGQTATLPIPPVLEHARAGTINVVAIMSDERHPLLPDVPTFREEGHDIVANDFFMVIGPVGISDDVLATLEEALLEVVTGETFTTVAGGGGMLLSPGGVEMATDELARQVEVIYPLLHEGGLVHPDLVRD